MKEYIFVWKYGGWWLKINTPEQLFDYYENTEGKWTQTFSRLINSKEFGTGTEHADNLSFAIGTYGINRNYNPIQATIGFRYEMMRNQLKYLLESGEIYINKNGGYHCKSKEKEYSQFIRRTEFVFPDFKENEIKVERFPGGNHFYAYIGDMQVRDGDTLKWDTYEEALNKAKEYING
jgi:hypothetical protein